MMGNWSQLSDDLLLKIVKKLKTFEDQHRIRAVCMPWRRTLKESSTLPQCSQLPLLLLPYCDVGKEDQQGSRSIPCQNNNQFCRGIFSISENKVYHFEFPEAYGKRCCGSSHGWLAMVENTGPSIFLLNSLTRRRIELPPLTTFPDILDFCPEEVGEEYLYFCSFSGKEETYSLADMEELYIIKVILTSDPTTTDCVVMAIYGNVRHLAFCRPGDTRWTVDVIRPDSSMNVDDVIYWRNQFYAVDVQGTVVVCDTEVLLNDKVFIKGPTVWIGGDMRYLVVDSSGKLMLVVRHLHYEEMENVVMHKTYQFDIYRLDEETKNWRKMEGLGEYAIFVGGIGGACLLASEFSHCKENCIYFTDDYMEGYHKGEHWGHDLGIYSLNDNSIERFPCCPDKSKLICPAPIWVTPSLGLN